MMDFSYTKKQKCHIDAKKAIATIAKKFIQDQDTIILDAGSTTVELAKLLFDKKITIYTRDLCIAMEFAENTNVDLFFIGGKLQPHTYSFLDDETVDSFSKLHVDTLFLSADSLALESGVYCHNPHEANLKTQMIKSANKVYLLADKSKLDVKTLGKVCDIADLTGIIINGISEDMKFYFESKGTEVYVVKA